jgi:hypothetical protein
MGESLEDMMLRRIGIMYDRQKVKPLMVGTKPERSNSNLKEPDMLVHTIRFVDLGYNDEEPESVDQLIEPNIRKRPTRG